MVGAAPARAPLFLSRNQERATRQRTVAVRPERASRRLGGDDRFSHRAQRHLSVVACFCGTLGSLPCQVVPVTDRSREAAALLISMGIESGETRSGRACAAPRPGRDRADAADARAEDHADAGPRAREPLRPPGPGERLVTGDERRLCEGSVRRSVLADRCAVGSMSAAPTPSRMPLAPACQPCAACARRHRARSPRRRP